MTHSRQIWCYLLFPVPLEQHFVSFFLNKSIVYKNCYHSRKKSHILTKKIGLGIQIIESNMTPSTKIIDNGNPGQM